MIPTRRLSAPTGWLRRGSGSTGAVSTGTLGRVSWIFVDGVAEPDIDRGDVSGASVDVVAFVGAHGHCAESLELVEGTLGGVAIFVGDRIEGRWPPAFAAPFDAVGDLVGRLGDGGGDSASPQVSTDLLVRVRLVAEEPAGPGTRTAGAGPRDAQPVHQRLERQRVVPLSRGGHPCHGPAAAGRQPMDLCGQPAAGPPQRLPVPALAGSRRRIVVIRPRPLCGPARTPARPAPGSRSPAGCPSAVPAAHPAPADVLAPPGRPCA